MSVTSLPAAVRRQVHERAGGCCEYCLLAEEDAFFPHEADHTHCGKTRWCEHPGKSGAGVL